ncbi:DUF5719 family protein [Microlunatus soli]|uniref:Secreted protein n=1 Tax=Microlunatus soli TaxID=630515 RepID=A0A1H1XIB4_9ACTN|nr:DUF5719 family protein [Microlunatus soli]SDT08569.1 hypothetical protein SAMN04489812_4081 [Microlunatus soli]
MNALNAIRGWVAVAVAALVAAVIGLGGQFLPVQQQPAAKAGQPLVGRTTSVCTTGTLNSADTTDSTESQVYGVAAKTSAAAGSGSLIGRELGDSGAGTPPLSVNTQGQGKIVSAPKKPIELTADGIMAGSSAGMVYGAAENGEDRGLSLAPCTNPAVDQWFTGLGATDALRSQLVISNPDDKQAEIDLNFSSPDGPLTVPGGSGLLIPAGRSRTLSLPDLLGNTDGDITVHVHASIGRVSAIARDLRSDGDKPAGVDWHPASVAPATGQVIPAVPGGPGKRQLVISNPGDRRATAKIEILGPQGPFTPVGTNQASVEAHSSTTVDVAKGLAEQIGTVRVTSDQPVLTAMRSERSGQTKPNDFAIETSQPAINATGVAPAAVVDGAETEVAVSNGSKDPTTVEVALYNLQGVSLYDEKIPVVGGGSIERRVTQAGPAYLVVKAADGAQVYGGVTLRQQSGDVYGLTSASLITPGLAGTARTSDADPRVAQ